MNDRISKQRELIAKKEGKFYTNVKDFQDRIKALPFEAGQNVWLQNSDSRKYEEAVIREKCREPNSYMVQVPATGQCFRRNSNFIKPRQTDKNSVSTDPLPTTGLQEIPQEAPVFQQPSSQATSTVDAIPTVPPFEAEWKFYSKNFKDSQTSSSIQKKYQRNSTPKAWTTRVTFRVQTFLFQKGRCCNMGQNDTIGKIELNPSIVLSSNNNNNNNNKIVYSFESIHVSFLRYFVKSFVQ